MEVCAVTEWDAQERSGLFIDRDQVTLSGYVSNSFFCQSRVNLDGALTVDGCHIHETVFNRRGHDLTVTNCVGGELATEYEDETVQLTQDQASGPADDEVVWGYSVRAMTVWGIVTALLGCAIGLMI
jgi:hypothetical protein